VAAHDLPAGQVLSRADIAIKSPSDGLPPYEIDKFIGRMLGRALVQDENLRYDAMAPNDGA